MVSVVSTVVIAALVAEVATRVFGAEKVLTVFMPSEFTSTMSHEDARELAMNLGVEMLTMPIDGLRREAARVVGEANVGGRDGLWEENVQARLRAVLAMAVSNRRGHVLLNTSNRSEIRGYVRGGERAGGFVQDGGNRASAVG